MNTAKTVFLDNKKHELYLSCRQLWALSIEFKSIMSALFAASDLCGLKVQRSRGGAKLAVMTNLE